MRSTTLTVVCRSEAETMALGERLVARLDPDAVVLVRGGLGVGKTVLVKGIARGLGIPAEAVQSPTFTIINEHLGPESRLAHLDLYRLERPEVAALGVEEVLAAQGVAVVEWPERLPWSWPGAVEIEVRVGEDGERLVELPIELGAELHGGCARLD